MFFAVSQRQIQSINARNIHLGRGDRHANLEESALCAARATRERVGRIETDRETVGKESIDRGADFLQPGFNSQSKANLASRKLKWFAHDDSLDIPQRRIAAFK